MSAQDFFLKMIKDDNLIITLYFKIFDESRRKSSIVTSCRGYQIVVILTLLYLSRNKIMIEQLIKEEEHSYHLSKIKSNPHKLILQNIVKNILSNKGLMLNQIIVLNKRNESYMSTIQHFEEAYLKPIDDDEDISICPLCIYANSSENFGSIVHYFTMVNCKGTNFLCSSYGSNFVKVPPKIIQITDLSELNFLFENLTNIKTLDEENFNLVRTLFNKYFLPMGVSKPFDSDDVEEDPALKFKLLDFESGKKLEWKYIQENTYSFSFAIIDPYIDELISLLTTYGKKRKKKKNRKKHPHKRKNTRKKKGKKRKRNTRKNNTNI